MTYLQVSEIMTRAPVSVNSGISIREAAKVMKSYKISSVLVLDKKELVGILTVDDIVRLSVAIGLDVEKVSVDEIMTRNVVSIAPDKDISDVMDLFSEYEIRQLPVLDGKKLVGFITLKDVLRFEPAMLDIAVGGLRLEEENRQRDIAKMADSREVDEDDEDLFE